METKKRERDEEEEQVVDSDLGFGTPAAGLAGQLAHDLCLDMGTTLQFVNDTLSQCKTLKQFKTARSAIETFSLVQTVKVGHLTMKMANDKSDLKKQKQKK